MTFADEVITLTLADVVIVVCIAILVGLVLRWFR